jgi:hypothetical protein
MLHRENPDVNMADLVCPRNGELVYLSHGAEPRACTRKSHALYNIDGAFPMAGSESTCTNVDCVLGLNRER